MAALIQLKMEVNKWKSMLKNAMIDYNRAHSAIYGYECGHPYTRSETDRLQIAHYNIVLYRKKLQEAEVAFMKAKDAIEMAQSKTIYKNTWRNEPTLLEAYGKK